MKCVVDVSTRAGHPMVSGSLHLTSCGARNGLHLLHKEDPLMKDESYTYSLVGLRISTKNTVIN